MSYLDYYRRIYPYYEDEEIARNLYDYNPEFRQAGIDYGTFASRLGVGRRAPEPEPVEPEPPERGFIGELGAAIPRILRESAGMGLRAVRTALPEAIEPEFLTRAIEDVEEELEDPEYRFRKGRLAEKKGLARNIIEGFETFGKSTIPMLTGAAVGGLVGGVPGAVVGAGTAGATIFGGAEYDQFIEEANDLLGDKYKQKYKAQGYGDQEAQQLAKQEIADIAHPKAVMSAIAEGGFEGLSNVLDILTFRVGGKIASKVLGDTVKKKLAKPLARYAVNTIGVAASEVPTEAATGYVQAGLRRPLYEQAGLKAPEPMEWATEGAKGALYAAPFFGLLGMGAQRRIAPQQVQQEEISKALGSDEERQELVDERIGEITGTRIKPEDLAPTPAEMRQFEIDLQMPEYGAETIARPTRPLTKDVLRDIAEQRRAEREAAIDEFTDRVARGEKMESPEDLQFYENNKGAIEARLQNIAQGALDVTPDEARMAGVVREGEEVGRPIQEQGAGPEAIETGGILQAPEEAPGEITDVTQLPPKAPRVAEAEAEKVPEEAPEPQLPKDLDKYKVRVKAMREATGEIIEIEENADTAIKEVDNRMSIYDQLLNCLSG